jgi:hypothetical protein
MTDRPLLVFPGGPVPTYREYLVAAVVSPPPKGAAFGRVAFATAEAATAAECRVALDAASAALVMEEA